MPGGGGLQGRARPDLIGDKQAGVGQGGSLTPAHGQSPDPASSSSAGPQRPSGWTPKRSAKRRKSIPSWRRRRASTAVSPSWASGASSSSPPTRSARRATRAGCSPRWASRSRSAARRRRSGPQLQSRGRPRCASTSDCVVSVTGPGPVGDLVVQESGALQDRERRLVHVGDGVVVRDRPPPWPRGWTRASLPRS